MFEVKVSFYNRIHCIGAFEMRDQLLVSESFSRCFLNSIRLQIGHVTLQLIEFFIEGHINLTEHQSMIALSAPWHFFHHSRNYERSRIIHKQAYRSIEALLIHNFNIQNVAAPEQHFSPVESIKKIGVVYRSG